MMLQDTQNLYETDLFAPLLDYIGGRCDRDYASASEADQRALRVITEHGRAMTFLVSDGADPEWASWYAAYLQVRLWDALGRVLSRSEIVYVLIRGDLEARASDDPSDWPSVDARLLRDLANS